jgi:hypothetical protein
VDANEVNPGLRASMSEYMKIIPLDPSSTILVGWEDPATPIHSNHSRSTSLVVSVESDCARLAQRRADYPMSCAAQ